MDFPSRDSLEDGIRRVVVWQRNLQTQEKNGLPNNKNLSSNHQPISVLEDSNLLFFSGTPNNLPTSCDPHVTGVVKLQNWQPACHLVHGVIVAFRSIVLEREF